MLSKLQSPVIALTTSLITTFTLYVSTLSLIGITAKSNQDTAYVQIQRCPHNFTTDTRYDDQSLQKSATAYTHTTPFCPARMATTAQLTNACVCWTQTPHTKIVQSSNNPHEHQTSASSKKGAAMYPSPCDPNPTHGRILTLTKSSSQHCHNVLSQFLCNGQLHIQFCMSSTLF
jgi:hypothetical protein